MRSISSASASAKPSASVQDLKSRQESIRTACFRALTSKSKADLISNMRELYISYGEEFELPKKISSQDQVSMYNSAKKAALEKLPQEEIYTLEYSYGNIAPYNHTQQEAMLEIVSGSFKDGVGFNSGEVLNPKTVCILDDLRLDFQGYSSGMANYQVQINKPRAKGESTTIACVLFRTYPTIRSEYPQEKIIEAFNYSATHRVNVTLGINPRSLAKKYSAPSSESVSASSVRASHSSQVAGKREKSGSSVQAKKLAKPSEISSLPQTEISALPQPISAKKARTPAASAATPTQGKIGELTFSIPDSDIVITSSPTSPTSPTTPKKIKISTPYITDERKITSVDSIETIVPKLERKLFDTPILPSSSVRFPRFAYSDLIRITDCTLSADIAAAEPICGGMLYQLTNFKFTDPGRLISDDFEGIAPSSSYYEIEEADYIPESYKSNHNKDLSKSYLKGKREFRDDMDLFEDTKKRLDFSC